MIIERTAWVGEIRFPLQAFLKLVPLAGKAATVTPVPATHAFRVVPPRRSGPASCQPSARLRRSTTSFTNRSITALISFRSAPVIRGDATAGVASATSNPIAASMQTTARIGVGTRLDAVCPRAASSPSKANALSTQHRQNHHAGVDRTMVESTLDNLAQPASIKQEKRDVDH